MNQHASLVTLGVADLPRSQAFYEQLGWTAHESPAEDVVFFQGCGMVIGLWSRESLAHDSGVSDQGGWGGVTLATNVLSPSEVDVVIEQARRAGAAIPREPAESFWGGYSGVFIDPDGHPWEVAHNPFWQVDAQGAVNLAADAG